MRAEAALQSALEQLPRPARPARPRSRCEPEAVRAARRRSATSRRAAGGAGRSARSSNRARPAWRARDQVDDARRTASLARQNLLPAARPQRRRHARSGLGTELRRRAPRRGPPGQRVPHHLLPARALAATAASTAVAQLDVVAARRAPCASASWRWSRRCARAVRELERIRKSVELQQQGRGGGRAAAPAGHPALPARAGLQLRRGGRGGQPGRWRAARSWACSPATRWRASSCCASPARWTWSRSSRP